MAQKVPREMTGAELKSMLKSSINFKSLGGVKCPGLKLSEEDMRWWRDAKIGLFIHFGLYSILGRGEWARFNEKIPKEEYEALADQLNPEDFSPKEWAALARDFGAKYMVMVTRHHDGFALWNSPGSFEQFNSWERGSKRDYVREYVDAARQEGLRTGLYYSPMDWRFPGYFDPEGLPESAALMKKQCYDQVEELCRDYGPVDILWYDGGWLAHKGSDTSSAWFWEPKKLNRMVREYNPKTVINPRSGWEGDFYCDEGSHEISGKIIPVPWEKNMCICSGSSWGWMADDPVSDFDCLIRMMANVVCRDGNWLVNIGPDRNGKVSAEVVERIRQVGAWLNRYGESVYGTRGGPLEPVDNVYGATCKENHLYLHILDKEAFARCVLPVNECVMLRDNAILSACVWDGSEDGELRKVPCRTEEKDGGLRVILPENCGIAEPDIIVEITLESDLKTAGSQEIYFTGR